MTRLFGWLLLVAVLIFSTNRALAEQRANIEITVIEAREGPPYLHESLKPMWELLKRSFGEKFTYYELLHTSSKTASAGEKIETTVPNSDSLTVIFEGVTEEKGLIRLTVEGGELKTKVRLRDGATFFLAGRKLKEGVLVIGIKAKLE